MKNLLRLFLFACLVALGALPAAAADKAKPPQQVIAVVDVQRILQESLAAKSVQKQLDTQRAKFQTETEGEENELRTAEQDLGKSRDQLAASVYADHEQQLRQRFLSVEQHVDARRKVLDQSFTDSMDIVRSHLLEVVHAVAQERGVNLVLIKQQTLWLDPSFDMTDEVLKRLNKNLPDVTVAATVAK
jgi:outer membrane protein